MATKTTEIKDILVTEYGYTKSDFVNEEGKALNYAQLNSLLKKEVEKSKEIEKEVSGDESSLNEFDEEAVEAQSKKFKDDDQIVVMSGINGKLLHKSQAGNGTFEFSQFGQKQQMPYKELKSMNNLTRETLERGWIMILNKDLIQEFGLAKEYEKFLTPNRINDILKIRTNELREIIEELPKDMRTTLFDEAKRRVDNGTLDSAFVVKTFEDIYDISFEDNLPLK